MITVIASITVKRERKEEFITLFKANVPAVLKEDGCLEYYPTVDLETGLPPQIIDESIVTIVEKWQSVEALRDHLSAPHMRRYQKQVKDMVAGVTIKVLQCV